MRKAHKFLRQFKGADKLPLAAYFGLGASAKEQVIGDVAALLGFINSRSSRVAQISLYGYLRTRAGARYPELFEREDMLAAINIAKWQIWLQCVGDLTLYCGCLLYKNNNWSAALLQQRSGEWLEQLFDEVGTPDEAGAEFAPRRAELLARVASADWQQLSQAGEEACFEASLTAMVHWSPIADELKQYDTEIIRNSIRFRWQEVRAYAREHLRLAAD